MRNFERMKKMISLLLALCMVMSFLPAPIFAADASGTEPQETDISMDENSAEAEPAGSEEPRESQSAEAVPLFSGEETRTVYLVFDGDYTDWLTDGNYYIYFDKEDSLVNETDVYVSCDTTVDGKMISELSTSDPVFLKVAVPAATQTLDIGSSDYSLMSLSLNDTDNVYFSQNGWVSFCYENPEALVICSEGTEIPAGTTALVMKSNNYEFTRNYGTILNGSFDCSVENYGTLAGGYYNTKVINREGGSITGGEYVGIGVENHGTITGGVFKDEDENTPIYNYNSADNAISDAVKNSGATIISKVNVTVNFTNLTYDVLNDDYDVVETVTVSPGTGTTTPGDDYVIKLKAAEGYVLPESIDVAVGGTIAPSAYYYVRDSEPTTGHIYVWAEEQTGDIVINIASYVPVFAQVQTLAVGDTLVVDSGLVVGDVVDGAVSGTGWSYDIETNTLSLADAKITSSYVTEAGEQVGIYCVGDLNLNISGENSITLGDGDYYLYGISIDPRYDEDRDDYISSSLNITGTGSLDITTGKTPHSYNYGLNAGNTEINGPNLNISVGDGWYSYGLSVLAFTLHKGDVTVETGTSDRSHDINSDYEMITVKEGAALHLLTEPLADLNAYNSWNPESKGTITASDCDDPIIVDRYLMRKATTPLEDGSDLDLTVVTEATYYSGETEGSYLCYVPDRFFSLSGLTLGELILSYSGYGDNIMSSATKYRNGEISRITLKSSDNSTISMTLIDGEWSCTGEHSFSSYSGHCQYCDQTAPVEVTINDESTFYLSFEEALEAVKDATADSEAVLKLCDDIVLDATQEISSVFTLDLDGNKLSISDSTALSLKAGADLTVVDTDGGERGTIASPVDFAVAEGASLTLKSGIYENGLTIQGTTIKDRIPENYAIYDSENTPIILSGEESSTADTVRVGIVNLSYATITLSQTAYPYTGHAIIPDVTVFFAGKEIDSSLYSVECWHNVNVGTARLAVTADYAAGIAGYVEKTFTIEKALPTYTAPTANTQPYTGEAQTLVAPGSATGAYLQYSLDNSTWSTEPPVGTDAGAYTVYYKLTGDDNHTDVPSQSISVSISPAELPEETAVTLEFDSTTYDGTKKEPTPKVTIGETILVQGTDYTVEWKENQNPGTATGTFTFIRNYQGTLSKTFTITCDHTYNDNNLTDNGDGTHSFTCSVCNAEVIDDHNFENAAHKCACGKVETFTVYWSSETLELQNGISTYGQTFTQTVTVPENTHLRINDVYLRDNSSTHVNYTYENGIFTIAAADMPAADIEIFCDHFVEVKFHANGGMIKPEDGYPLPGDTGFSEDGSYWIKEFSVDGEIDGFHNAEVSRTGYTFVDWRDASGKVYPMSPQFVQATEDVTIYAQWQCNHTIGGVKYRDNGDGTTHNGYCGECGELLGNYVERPHVYDETTHKCICGVLEPFTLHAEAQTLNVPYGSDLEAALADITATKTGYNHTGWSYYYLDEDGMEQPYTGTTMPAMELYAKPVFEAIEYQITWVLNGCTVNLDLGCELPETLPYNGDAEHRHQVKVYLDAPQGYTFEGFKDGDGNELEYIAANSWLFLTVTGDMTIEAIVEPESYMATWTDGDGASYEKTFKYGQTITIPTSTFFVETFRKSGYTVIGWEGYTEGMTMPIGGVTFTAKWHINAASLVETSGKYTGEAHTPVVTVEGLTEGEDFTVTYPADMTNVGQKVLTITGKLGGTTAVTYTITKADAPVITFPTVLNEITYRQQVQEAKLSFYENEYGTFNWAAPSGYPDGVGEKNYALDFYPRDLENYDWTTANWETHGATWIESRNALCTMGKVIVNKAEGAGTVSIEDWIYGESPRSPIPTSSTHGTDSVLYFYKAVDADDSTYSAAVPDQAGAYTVLAYFPATDLYTEAVATASFEIAKKELTPVLEGSVTKTFDNTNLLPSTHSLHVTLDGIIPEDDLTFTAILAYDGVDVGTIRVSATEITLDGTDSGNYTLKSTTAFADLGTITPKDISDAVITLWTDEGKMVGDETYIYDGTAKEPNVLVNLIDIGDTLGENSDMTVVFSDNVAAGTATVTVTGKGNYIGTASKTFVIGKAVPTYVVPTSLEATYGQQLKDVILPAGWVWSDDTAFVGDTGVQTHKANFIPENTDCYEIIRNVDVSIKVLPVDISDAVITLGESLTYTGSAQTQTIASVTVDGLTATYTVSGNTQTNVGGYVLTVTGTGNFTGTKTAYYTITPDTSAISGLTPENVTSQDKADVAELLDALENMDLTNATQEDKSALEDLKDQVKELMDSITQTEESVSDIAETVTNITPETVTSADKEDLTQTIETIDDLLEGTNLTPEERAALEEARDTAEALVELIDAVQDSLTTENTEIVENITSENVQVDDKENLESARDDLEQVLEDNGSNLTEEEKEAIQAELDRINGAIESIERVETVTDAVIDLPEIVTPGNPSHEAAVEAAVDAYEDLTDYEKSLVDDEIKSILDEAVAVLEDCDGQENCPSKAFTDLDTNLWYHEAIDYVLRNGFMQGYGTDKFKPDDALTRAMIVQVLYNMEGKPEVTGEDEFTDTKAGAWYADAVLWAYQNGIVLGHGNGKYSPMETLTREQMAAILCRYAEYKGANIGARASLQDFTDSTDTSAWAEDYVKWAVANGIINGFGDGTLRPTAVATRAQVAQIILNYFRK